MSPSQAGRGPIVASTVRVTSSCSNCLVGCTLSSTSRSLARSANRLIRPGAAYSANSAEVPSRSIRRPDPASRTSSTVRSCSPSISTARLASRSPPGVNASPEAVRLKSWSPSSRRSWPTCSDTAASVTPRSAAAALTDPSRTTVANARSWVGVMVSPNLTA